MNQGEKVFRVLITGPESAGKSAMCKFLSEFYQAPWVEEAARDYLTNLGRPYEQADLDEILKFQLRYEELKSLEATDLIICDTGPEVVYIWSNHKYGEVSDYIKSAIENVNYDLVLLMFPDLEWEPDPLREAPEPGDRENLYKDYEDLFMQNQIDFEVIKGSGVNRVNLAKEHIDLLLAE